MTETLLTPIKLPLTGPAVLACGADTANRVCITRGAEAFLGDAAGDLSEYAAYRVFQAQIDRLTQFAGVSPQIVAHDAHPDYLSTRYAVKATAATKVAVQHHHAHVAACMVEHLLSDKVIGVALDGTGYGPDGTVWGGEFLVADLKQFQRVAHFKQYRMPGGEQAILNPARPWTCWPPTGSSLPALPVAPPRRSGRASGPSIHPNRWRRIFFANVSEMQ